jgi:hypothetical protein
MAESLAAEEVPSLLDTLNERRQSGDSVADVYDVDNANPDDPQ